jgi:acyl carrier protein
VCARGCRFVIVAVHARVERRRLARRAGLSPVTAAAKWLVTTRGNTAPTPACRSNEAVHVNQNINIQPLKARDINPPEPAEECFGMSDTLARVAKVFSELMEVDPSDVTRETTASRGFQPDSDNTLEEWDSMAHVQLIVALEREFSLTISPDDAVDFESVGMICDWIDAKRQK